MKQKTLFRGIATALATPMTSSGAIDYDAYGRLIDWQIESGVAGLVTCGTTGEASTMTAEELRQLVLRDAVSVKEEHRQTIAFAVKRAAGRVPVIAGTGANCTEKAVELTRFACAAGADACLVVTPYYNKATQRGLIAHYTAIADASDRPVILYNVPSRTGCNLLPETCAALAGHPRIAAVKEASGNLSQIVSLFHRAAACLDVYSGNDDQIVPILAMGGEGCISVLSNVLPREAVQLCELFFSGDVRGAAALQCRLLPVIDALFSEVNPIPVKAALAKMGYGTDTLRLPLTPMEEGSRAVLLAALEAWGV